MDAQEDGVPPEKRIAHLALAAADIRGVRAGDNSMDVDGSAVRYSREELASLPKLANVEGMLELANVEGMLEVRCDMRAAVLSAEACASLPKLASAEGMLEAALGARASVCANRADMAHIQCDVKAHLEATAQQLLSAAEGSAAQTDGARPPPRWALWQFISFPCAGRARSQHSALHIAASSGATARYCSVPPASVAKAMRDEAQRRAAAAAALDAALLEATPLYNDYARRFAVWDACLVTIAACASDDAAEVEALWRALVWRAVPLRAGWEKVRGRSSARSVTLEAGGGGGGRVVAARRLTLRAQERIAQDWLNGTRASRDRPIMQHTAARLLGARSATLFEETGWQADLQAQVSALGQQLLSKPGGAAAFPLPLLVAELEELALHHAYAVAQRAKTDTEAAGATVVVDTVAERWPLEALLGAAPAAHAEVFAAYSNAARANERASGDKQLQLTVQVSRLVQSWLAAAANGGAAAVGGGGGASTAAASLAAANANGALARRIGDLRMRLMALPNISTKRSAAAQASAALNAALQELAKRAGGGAARDAAAPASTAGGFPALMWR
ncbi:hypothetical protein JKP88DRAFT_324210 [Tribonema minus]|uniref:Uncharacterized protein n=1 Tax=Tribonema minus TaxID=303371 RepID=A0A835YSE8_9STRA|nr:hypothetical protein JKP88DRAFT_324210 [Tribonema minus]